MNLVSYIAGLSQKSLEIILPAASKAHINGSEAPGASPVPHHCTARSTALISWLGAHASLT